MKSASSSSSGFLRFFDGFFEFEGPAATDGGAHLLIVDLVVTVLVTVSSVVPVVVVVVEVAAGSVVWDASASLRRRVCRAWICAAFIPRD